VPSAIFEDMLVSPPHERIVHNGSSTFRQIALACGRGGGIPRGCRLLSDVSWPMEHRHFC